MDSETGTVWPHFSADDKESSAVIFLLENRCCLLGTCMRSRFQGRWKRLWLTCQWRSTSIRTIRFAPKGGRCLAKHAFNEGSVVHYPSCATCIVEYCGIDQERNTLDALKPFVAPNGNDLGGRSSLTFGVYQLDSLRGFLRNFRVESLLGHQLLQPSVLVLHRLELLAISGCMPPTFCRYR